MKLDIYKKGKVVKTYEAETYDLMYGTVEDIFTVFDFDSMEKGTGEEILNILIRGVPKSREVINPLLKDVFTGLTDSELKNTKVKDIIKVLFEIIKFSLGEMSKGYNGKK